MNAGAPAPSGDVDGAIRATNAESLLRYLVADMKEIRGLLGMLLEEPHDAARIAMITSAIAVADGALGKR